MEEQNSISIYDLDDKKRYAFIGEVEDPLSHETVGIRDWKRDRLLLHKVKVLIDKNFLLLDGGNIVRIDIGKRLRQLNLEQYDMLSFDARIRHVPVDNYFDYDERGKTKVKWGAQLSPRGNLYYDINTF